MSALHNILKEIPSEIKSNLDFLELGFFNQENIGNNFTNIEGFKSKTSVDMDNPNATFTMLTDDFFTQNDKKYDIIYIDAGHHWENVLKDYNNAIDYLNDGGVIFFHDLYPTPELATPQYCWDGFKVLNHFWNVMKLNNFLTYKPDVGTTFIHTNFPKIEMGDIDQVDYQTFISNVSDCPHVVEDFDVWKSQFLKVLKREYVQGN
jgi:hypothetical protein